MRALDPLLRSIVKNGLARRLEPSLAAKCLSTSAQPVASNLFDHSDDFDRIFSGVPEGDDSSSFLRTLGKAQKARSQFSSAAKGGGDGDTGADGNYNTLQDGMGQKLMNTAAYFKFDTNETVKQDSGFRPDNGLFTFTNNDFKDSGYRNLRVQRPSPRQELKDKVTTAEVLKKADFRNVRFLSNFLTEAGIIIKRSKSGISAKAQRKIAREIKTARAFGLMPFTTMGTKAFRANETMEEVDGNRRVRDSRFT
ncbi:30S ribosomal protein S18 [Linum perenne]